MMKTPYEAARARRPRVGAGLAVGCTSHLQARGTEQSQENQEREGPGHPSRPHGERPRKPPISLSPHPRPTAESSEDRKARGL